MRWGRRGRVRRGESGLSLRPRRDLVRQLVLENLGQAERAGFGDRVRELVRNHVLVDARGG